MNFYGRNLDVVKTNLHSHTRRSDGASTAAELIDAYRTGGYGALAFTDHWKTNPVSGFDGKGMTLLSGIELHPMGPRGINWHLLAIGVPEEAEDYGKLGDAQQIIDRVREQGGICFAAHPCWCGLTSAEVATLKRLAGIEVYNASTRYIGKAYNMQLWDELLDAGLHVNAIAVDDVHRAPDLFRGWTMICAEDHSPAGLIEALRQGDYYASQGPEFRSLRFEGGIFEAEFSPCSEAVMLTNKNDGYSLEDGRFTSIRFDAGKLPANAYLRCQIRDAAGNYAWSNPIRL